MDEAEIQVLRRCLSEDRFGRYLEASHGDAVQAVRLYAWNVAASAALFGPLHLLEVALRNAMHVCLTTGFGEDWYDSLDDTLAAGCRARISEARRRLQAQHSTFTSGALVASLPFGFWVSLLGPGGRKANGHRANYEMTLWRPCLRFAFAHCESPSRRYIHAELNGLRQLRNRVAHHEPVFQRDLVADRARILAAVGWMSPELADWVRRHSRLEEMLATDRAELIRW